MNATERSNEGQSSSFRKEASPEGVTTGEKPKTNQKYRMLTEDEILGLTGRSIKWSDRMKEESNLVYRLKYSKGKITESFIEGVIESLEGAGDFQITSIGYTRFILFVAGNQPYIEEDYSEPHPFTMYRPHKRALKRLFINFEELKCPGAGNSYQVSKSGNEWHPAEIQKNTLMATLKPNISFFVKTWGEE